MAWLQANLPDAVSFFLGKPLEGRMVERSRNRVHHPPSESFPLSFGEGQGEGGA